MLGGGRPFVIEVKEPRSRDVDPAELEAEINEFADGKVEVEGLRLATHDMVERVKEHDASKTYRMAVEFAEPVTADQLDEALTELDGATIYQDTPQRVSHRRADITRTREVYDIDGELEDSEARSASDNSSGAGPERSEGPDEASGEERPVSGEQSEPREGRHATIEVHGEGGLYVKELVSGDEGRTDPSLAGLLGVGAVVTALDVLDVEGENEPFALPEFFQDEAES